MIETAVYIALWSYLFTAKLTKGGMVFGPLRAAVQRLLGDTDNGWQYWIFHPLFECPKCHAGQLSFWYCCYEFGISGEFNLKIIILAVFIAAFLEDHYDNFFAKGAGR
jgi:hypothetical protein